MKILSHTREEHSKIGHTRKTQLVPRVTLGGKSGHTSKKIRSLKLVTLDEEMVTLGTLLVALRYR